MEAPDIQSSSDVVKPEEIFNNDEKLSEVQDSVQMDNESSDEEDCENSLTIADDDEHEDTQINQKNDDTTQERATGNHTENTVDEKSQENDTSNSTTQEAVVEDASCVVDDEKQQMEDNIKQHETQIPKLNGNHCLSLNDADESSCSSSTSSASSHNLVIDHPLAEEIRPKIESPSKEDTECIEKVTEGKSLKRKLSICENGSPQHKRSYLDFTRGSPQEHLELDFKLNQAEPDHEIVQAPAKSNEVNFLSPVRSASFWESSMASQYPQETPEQGTNISDEVTRSPLSAPSFWQKSLQDASRTMDKVQNIDEVEIRNSPRTSNVCEQSLPTPSAMAVPEATEKNFEEFVRSPPTIHNIWEKMLAPTRASPSPYEQYALFSDSLLPAPKLNFQCFKCKQAEFDNFTKLRDHHKVCLFKENHKKLPPTSTSSPTCQVVVAKSKPSAPLAQPTEPPPPALPQTKKRFYLCSSCGTYHENWNLFLHIREIHNRHVCLYCIRLFPTAEKLSLHLEIKHDLEQNHFNSEEKLRSVSKGDGYSRFLMCCTCQHVFSEHERFSDHICTEYLQQCSVCGQKGRHLNNCKANPEKRSGKVKKKAKILPPPATATKSSNIQQRLPPTTLMMPSPVTPATVCDSKYNNNQTVLAALPLSLQTATPPMPNLEQEFSKQNGYSELALPGGHIEKPPEDYNYHSDDSTNMVIDETCSNTNYASEMAGVNPFKALDERERLQEEVQKVAETKTTLPPDRVPEAIPEPKPLIVPKIKLRVPKEFQKAVESEISSTDSEEEDDGEEEEEEDDEKEQNTESALDNYAHANDDVSDENDDKDNTQDMDESNSNLNRILQEIEKTKMDIRRTKEMLEPMNNLKRPSPKVESPKCPTPVAPSPCPMESAEENLDNVILENVPRLPLENSIEKSEPASWETPERGICSPTPPPTPNSVWSSPLHLSQVSPDVLQAVSERENIENMEKESEQSKDLPSESEKIDTSLELDVSSIPNQEESAMEVEESKEEINETSIPSTPAIEFPSLNDAAPTNQIADELKPEEEDDEEIEVVKESLPPADGIELANEDVLITDLLLDRPLEKFEIVEFVRLCVRAVYALCLYCNHARRIAVNGHSLVLHLLAQHRFAATVDSITAEELLPSTIVAKLKSFLPDLEQHYFNLESYCSVPPKENNTIACNERTFECFQCRFSTKMHKDLYLHNRKMHLKTAILCYMCRANFFSFSEILCHICPGMPNKVTVFDIKFRCCLCDVDEIPSPFRLMVHLRKKHFACDICLEDCREQGRLSSHVWKHKLHHLCYRCGIAYRNKMDITKHLFWKHGTESIICKRCLQKRWRHVYHFCVPPTSFVCDLCNLCFSKATYLKVHKRVHTGDFRYPCTEESCEEKFISRKLLLKHSIIHAPAEVKVEEKIEDVAEPTGQPEDGVKVEETPKEEKPIDDATVVKEDVVKEEEKTEEKPAEPVSKRKKKKNRNKESLEDLNLIAPNLSESDSSDDSDGEKPKTDDTDALVPNVMLSPPSEDDKDEEKEATQPADNDAGKIMDIWENFKSFQASQQPKLEEDDNMSLSESNYPTPILHVACSDHDYCAMYKIRPRVTIEEVLPIEPKPVEVLSDTERDLDVSEKRQKSISPNKKKRKSTGSGSSSSDSSSGSDSSCSCGSNCSCSSSGSSSNSSSSSDDNSDSSTSEGRRRIAAKKQSRAERNRLKSESSLKVSHSESVDVVVEDKETIVTQDVSKVMEPVIIETDLETAESDTDEEFYDEHPQKLASEMLAQKRLQLQEQMRLSPSHNFDIMENSRPSTPSLPEEMVKEKKVKLKKKKRDRKSTSKSQAVPPIKLNLSVQRVEIANEQTTVHETSMQVPEVDLVPPYDLIASPGVAEPPVAQQPALLSTSILQNNTLRQHIPFAPSHSRMSEGSSCSDADNSLKRSKRARRPNKFYGYTSDDENMPGTPLMIGTRTFKPQPPPQLTWRKEDLPAPSKSILLNKQPRSPRTPKTPGASGGQVKKRSHQKSSAKKKQHKLPPIPTLKIRPSKIGIVPALSTTLPPPLPPPPANNAYLSSRDDSDDSDSSDDDLELPASSTIIPAASIPLVAPAPVKAPTPPPPTPQASVFNQKIPPALLPNPDFATLQYFKRNNIRYPIRPPAGARQPRDGESVYCYCRCPYDEVSEMIACDGESCLIEWFHFECVGIMVAPQGKWFCAECRPKYSNELYPKV